MEINVSTDMMPLTHVVSPKSSQPSKAEAADSAAFASADRLDHTLRQTADVRPERVSRAQELLGDAAYPPAAVFRSIAALLAMHLDNNESSS